MDSGQRTRLKKLMGPATGFCAYIVNVLLLIFALCLRLAHHIKNLTFCKTAHNFSSNVRAITSISIRACYTMNNCWDAGWRTALGTIREAHAWYYCFTWSLVWLLLQGYLLLIRSRRIFKSCWFEELLLEVKQYLARRSEPPDKTCDWMASDENRRHDRRLKKYRKRYQVHTVSNTWEAQYGKLRHFNLGNGWFVRFCICCICFEIPSCFGLSSQLTDEETSFSNWIWVGRPPDSILEHVTLASIGSFLVIFAFTITTSIALSRIRSKAKKGATMSALCVTAISSANHLDKLLFFSFVRAAVN